ncbi:hypothetical protein [Actinomadura chokoriensis]|uniref:hypothetical protein n=1 Tax=Actinomadura chokoriensis TaxID=454156 RepID=UPI0031F7B830
MADPEKLHIDVDADEILLRVISWGLMLSIPWVFYVTTRVVWALVPPELLSAFSHVLGQITTERVTAASLAMGGLGGLITGITAWQRRREELRTRQDEARA